MGVLSDRSILRAITANKIIIEPFRRSCLGSNSYDIHLGKYLGMYKDNVLDCKKDNHIEHREIPDKGVILTPGNLYLGITEEYTDTCVEFMPNIDGKSSIGRLGIFIHITAGRGDAGFNGFWTLEIMCIKPVRIYPGMPIGQITYETIEGPVAKPYNKKKDAKYHNKEPKPIQSMMWKNWDEERQSWIQED
ncbi:MAG: dCTP deaminase [Candidatus Thorarchaeota archaeon]|nr:dCTP deaminase [Thermoplasmatales archaeon]